MDILDIDQEVNFNIASDVINEIVRVSTAGIWSSSMLGGKYLQYESWIFSNDKAVQKSVMVIHGTSHDGCENLKNKALKVHGYLVNNMKKKFNQQL